MWARKFYPLRKPPSSSQIVDESVPQKTPKSWIAAHKAYKARAYSNLFAKPTDVDAIDFEYRARRSAISQEDAPRRIAAKAQHMQNWVKLRWAHRQHQSRRTTIQSAFPPVKKNVEILGAPVVTPLPSRRQRRLKKTRERRKELKALG